MNTSMRRVSGRNRLQAESVADGVKQGVTSCFKSVHRITGYQGYQPYIRGIRNGCQEKTDQISIKYLTDFIRILQNVCWMYLNISEVSVDRGQRVKKT